MKKLLTLCVLGGIGAALYRWQQRAEVPVQTQKKLAWGRFSADVTEEQRRRLALTAARRRA